MFEDKNIIWAVRPSNNEIDKAGKILVENPSDKESLKIVNDWRVLHYTPLIRLRKNIDNYFKKQNKSDNVYIVQRLKRMPTLISKVKRMGENSKLSGFQDIGGLRCVVDTIADVYALYESLSNKRKDFSFEKDPKINDYITIPKTRDKKGGYGYRSFHAIYRFISDNDQYNKLRVELQIRTKLQHYWATAVETIDFIQNKSIKYGIGADEWNEFFAVVSSLFALKENTPVFQEHVNYTKNELLNRFLKLERHLDVIQKLEGIQQIKTINRLKSKTRYCLIALDISGGETEVREYQKIEDGYKEFIALEEKILSNKSNKIALFVNSYELEKLKKAYSAYFLDVQEFVRELKELAG